MTRYDQVPYPALVHPATDPSRIIAIGRLYGLAMADPDSARVLDVGCGIGANLHSMAAMLPDAQFVGLDLASTQIEIARDIATTAGLGNTRWISGNVMGPDPELGDFDVMLLHGLVSWVPTEVRQACWRLCRNHLREGGMALVSYNTYPGWHSKQILRQALQVAEKMLFEGRDTRPQEKLRAAMALVNEWLAEVPRESVYGKTLRDELRRVQHSDVDYLLHEFFEPVNQPFLFHELHDEMHASGLRFVNESDWTSQRVIDSSQMEKSVMENTAGAWKQQDHASNRVSLEQSVDFLLGRRFRSSLVCLRDTVPLDLPDWNRLHGMCLACIGLRQEVSSVGQARYQCEDGSLVSVSDTGALSLLQRLAEAAPQRVPVSTLLQDNASWTIELMRRLTILGVTCAYASQTPASNRVSLKPRTSALVRYQASRSDTVSSALHRNVKLDRGTRWLLELCDGTRTLDDLADAMTDRSLEAGVRLPSQLTTEDTGAPDDRRHLRDAIAASLPSRLGSLVKAGLLWKNID
ncbi:MAG: class I SAM-dependent methyltransferase [Planctomycetota bacterium]